MLEGGGGSDAVRELDMALIVAGSPDWAASARWSSPAYLLAKAGPSRVVPVEVGRNYTEDGWGQRIITFEEFLDSLESGTETLYLAQHDLFRQVPELRDDVEIPDLVYAAPDPPENYPTYKPPASEDGYVLNAWLGPAGTVSPAHTDPYFNCYAQVVGSKWIWVAPPEISPSMTTFGVEPDSTTSIYMSNTARIDVTDPPDSPQVTRFPDFVRDVVPIAQQAVLEEGDLLFMPPGWWHGMKSLEVSFSVSIWF
ncbi:hypothetical protein RQP46_003889 [Phenoliferia psychrophenolica]